jgi:LacI family transcriptional regulator
MRDVAALAGVSLKTVSRVINGESTVDPALAARVRRAAMRLDYQPNLAARSLRSLGGKTRSIGLLLENVANPFSSALHRAVEDLARLRGVAVLAGSLDEEPRREHELVRALVARRVDGLLIVPTGEDHGYLANERRAGVSIVFVDRPPRLFSADVVLSENTIGARAATLHLVAGGHRRIAYLGDLRSIQTAADRTVGYTQALLESGIALDERLIVHDLHDAESAEAAARALLIAPEPPSALFTTQNLITIGAIRALRALDQHHRVALVGFDDFTLADLLEPPVTVVAQDPARLGRLACEILFERMDGDDSPPRRVAVPTRLIARGSGEIPPQVADVTRRERARARRA